MSRKYASSAKYDWQQSVKPRIAPLTAAVTGALAASSLQAATITVTTLDDGLISGECSLRSALYAASSNAISNACPAGDVGMDDIVFAPGLNGTIQLVAGQGIGYGADDSTLPIGDSVTIDGDNRITVRGTGNGGVFYAKYDADAGLNAEDVTISNITITNGGGETRGGGINSRARFLTVTGSTITNNNASLSGGGIHHQPFIGGYDKGLLISDSTISGNFTITAGAGGGGGGVFTDLGNGGNVGILNSDFNGNFATGGNGGGLYARINDYAYLTIKYSEFDGNDAKYSSGNGGGIFAELGYATAGFYGNTFTSNQAGANGGGLFLREDVSGFQQAEITLNDNDIAANQAGTNGGGASITVLYGDDGTIAEPVKTVDFGAGNTFFQNVADGGAGGLDLRVGEAVVATISGTTFDSNTANNGSGGAANVAGYLSAIYASEVSFSGNDALAGAGGGLQVTATESTFGIEQSTFYDNVAGGGCGGGLRVSSSAEQVGVAYSIFYSNSASACGGGMSLFAPSLENSIVEVKYNEIANNTANDSVGLYASFGSGTTMFLTNSTVSGNTATGATGGGVRFAGAMTAELKYSTVANNYANGDGAGLFNSATNCNISNSILAGNENSAGQLQDLNGSVDCDVSNSLLAGAKYSDYTNGGGNILNTDPLIGPLAGNGGWGGFTHALQTGSPAIDAGSAGAYAPDFDQRGIGFPRVSGAGLDMGAYELFIDTIFSDRFEQP